MAVDTSFAPISGFLYLLKGIFTTNTFYKIGYTKNIQQRLKGYNIKIPTLKRVELLHAIPVNDKVNAEKYFHQYFKTKNAQGEWFNLDQEDIDWFMTLDENDVYSLINEY